eukprot:scaffold8896_cov67-Phaeocystis_antarctica.AAC.1
MYASSVHDRDEASQKVGTHRSQPHLLSGGGGSESVAVSTWADACTLGECPGTLGVRDGLALKVDEGLEPLRA